MSLGKTLAFVGALAAFDAGEDIYKGDSPRVLEWLGTSNAALNIVANPAYETHGGQTQLYLNPADNKWYFDHIEVDNDRVTFDLSKGDSLQEETDVNGNPIFRVGVRHDGKRFYANIAIPDTDKDNDGSVDQHITPAGAYTENTTFYQQVPNIIQQNPGTDTININGNSVKLP